MNSLIRDVFERSPQFSAKPVDVGLADKTTGFPTVQHRLTGGSSVFKRARQQGTTQRANSASSRAKEPVPTSAEELDEDSSRQPPCDQDDISRSADVLLAGMTDEERAQGREEILEHFGPEILETMEKLKGVRERRKIDSQAPISANPLTEKKEETAPKSGETSQPIRRIRFVEPTESDIHVYETSPVSPKRPIGLLPPPSNDLQNREDDRPLYFSSRPNNRIFFTSSGADPEMHDDSTPEVIRQRFFPSESRPEDNQSLAWMLPQSTSAFQRSETGSSSIRYSLSGTPLSPSEIRDLPTHLGLHHHAETSSAFSSDAPAGYTLEDLLHLSRSSALAQRVGVLGVLGKIFRNTYTAVFSSIEVPMKDIYCSVDLDALRRDIFDTTVEAITERGWLGQRALDVLWELVVGCTQAEMGLNSLDNFPSVDLTPLTTEDANTKRRQSFLLSIESATFLATLPIQRLLVLLKTHLVDHSSQSPTFETILDILYILCHFFEHARSFVDSSNGSGIISTILAFHLSPSVEPDNDSSSNRKSIRILQVLAQSSRDVAQHLLGPADMLLKYVITIQNELELNSTHVGILQETLLFYTCLMRYGFFAGVFSTTHTHISLLLSTLQKLLWEDLPGVTPLFCTYLEILETIIVCATDPHQTTPQHDVVWSQIEAFGWMDQVFDVVDALVKISTDKGLSKELETLWTRVFHILAAWTEGAHLNGIKNGESEKNEVIVQLRPEVADGPLGILLHQKLEHLKKSLGPREINLPNSGVLEIKSHISLVTAYLRLFLASTLPNDCLPVESLMPGLSEISNLILESGATSDVFHIVTATNVCRSLSEDLHLSIRHLSTLLFLILRIRFPSPDLASTSTNRLWIRDALRVLHTFLPGDERLARWVVQHVCLIFNWDSFMQGLPDDIDCQSERQLNVLLPFWSDSFVPKAVVADNLEKRSFYPSFWANAEEISRITSLHLPSLSALRRQWSQHDLNLIFPLRSTWILWPLDHLLRSGTSVILKSLPSSWDATELEVARVTLLFTLVVQHLSRNYPSNMTSLSTLSRDETSFAGMKVFMLEHDQRQLEAGEIYRDSLVEKCLNSLLSLFTFRNANDAPVSTHPHLDADSLELVSRSYLGTSTPFYQFYTDLLALYDSVSFSHPLFAKVLLPPLSLSYSSDYRALFFGDYGHLVRTINIEPEDILSVDIEEYLWPIERNPRILSSFLSTLFRYTTHGFLRWFIIHHLATNIWPIAQEEFDSNRSTRLLKAIISQEKECEAHIKDIFCYYQTRGEIIFPPHCYDRRTDLLDIRRRSIEGYDVSLRGTLENIFLQL